MTRISRMLAIIILLLGVVALSCGPGAEAPVNQPAPLPAPIQATGATVRAEAPGPDRLAGDKDRFRLYVNEDPVGVIDYELEATGAYRSTFTMSMAGQSMTVTTTITAGDDGRWQRIVVDSPQGEATVEPRDDQAVITHKGKSVSVELAADAVLFSNGSPALLGYAVARYDRDKGGEQTIPLFVIPQTATEVEITRLDDEERAIAGVDRTFRRYRLTVEGVDLEAWAGADHRIYLIDVPVQRAAFVRDGYELLRSRAGHDDPLLSKPAHEIATSHIAMPMRDGVELATLLYRPKTTEKVPVILIRTPYKKEMQELKARFYARRGYAVAVQDVRGRFASKGTWEPFVNEADDGHDAVEWLARQPWSNARVGMIGGSYLGWVQWWAASRRPPHLVTIIPNVSPPDPFYNFPYEYGVFFLYGAIWWADIVESEATADIAGTAFATISEKRYSELLRHLPVIDLDKRVLGKENMYWRQWIKHNANDRYWKSSSFLDKLENVNIPVFHQSGWFDGDGIGSKLNYGRMKSHGHDHQKLVLGPWGHTDTAGRRIGDRDFGPRAVIDLQRAYLRWFDHWLKGVDNGITKEPLVEIFAMGSNQWLKGNTYPLEVTKYETWYLASGGKANTANGDGRLSRSKPTGAARDTYIYDPGDPTPHPDYFEAPEREEGSEVARSELEKAQKAHHRQVTETRKDILVYHSEPFTEPYTFAGPIEAVLHAATSGKDTDWFVSLMEVNAKGEIFPLVQGKIRARFRQSPSMDRPTLVKPGKVYRYNIDLWQTGITLAKGSRLRVEVASAAFPMFSRNLNTGGHNELETRYQSATQHIHHSKRYPSHIRLPMIPASAMPKD